ncbi:MAG TPA: RluA family pseudouridine synthase [Candidatus Binatia bacterium]|jgi:23S rRNA pseudouridine1911/1915/1917 synthase
MNDGDSEQSWTVPADVESIRLDAFVHRCLPHLSLREAQKAIGERGFWINDRAGKKGDRLVGGDRLRFHGARHWLAPAPIPRADLGVVIRYEDESILALDKPAGIATHGFSGRETASLANFLAAVRPALRDVGPSRWEPGLVNRLDRGTSGLVLAAKDQASFEDLRAQSRGGLIKKKYWALVWGKTGAAGTIALPLTHDTRDRKKITPLAKAQPTKPAPKNWRASTRFRRRGYAQGFSLVEVEIERGVTHQIRVHLEASGHPLVGDPLYGAGRSEPFDLPRQFLHASGLEFRHPKDGRKIVIESPLPEELREVLDRLRIKI